MSRIRVQECSRHAPENRRDQTSPDSSREAAGLVVHQWCRTLNLGIEVIVGFRRFSPRCQGRRGLHDGRAKSARRARTLESGSD